MKRLMGLMIVMVSIMCANPARAEWSFQGLDFNAAGVSADGSVIVGVSTNPPNSERDSPGIRAFLWDSRKGMSSLGTIDNASSQAWGMNNAGEVGGQMAQKSTGWRVYYLLQRSGGLDNNKLTIWIFRKVRRSHLEPKAPVNSVRINHAARNPVQSENFTQAQGVRYEDPACC